MVIYVVVYDVAGVAVVVGVGYVVVFIVVGVVMFAVCVSVDAR